MHHLKRNELHRSTQEEDFLVCQLLATFAAKARQEFSLAASIFDKLKR